MSDDEDYMSDKFLSGCVGDDIRPGLIKSHSDKRSFNILKRKREFDDANRKKNLNLKLLEFENRKEGLEKPIDQSNKGFAMLEKMGYKPGTRIGKKETGLVEPISIQLRPDREGLGRAQAIREHSDKKMKEMIENVISVDEYRSRVTEKVAKRQIENDFRKSQRMCESLDLDNDMSEPIEEWYWYNTDPNNEKIVKQKLTNDKRKKNRKDDSELFEDEYMETEEINDTDIVCDTDEYSDDADLPEINLGINEKLWDITTYLRNKYFYCIWCSVKYNDEGDLNQECPGRTRELH